MSDEKEIVVFRGGVEPFPSPELDLGNLVRLKEPYVVYDEEHCKHEYTLGVIVQHVSRNFMGIPKVCLHVFNVDGQLLLDQPGYPSRVDLTANSFTVIKIAARAGVSEYGSCLLNDGSGYDLYLTCPGCGDKGQHPFQEDTENKCPQCFGWGFIRNRVRLDGSSI